MNVGNRLKESKEQLAQEMRERNGDEREFEMEDREQETKIRNG